MTTPAPTIPIGGTIRTAVGRPVSVAAEVSATPLAGQSNVAGDNVQSILDSIVNHIETLPSGGGGGSTTTPAVPPILTTANLSRRTNLNEPSSETVQTADWTTLLTHTVTAAEANLGYMLVDARVWAIVARDSDNSGDRPAMVARLTLNSNAIQSNIRYFRFSGGHAMDCPLSAIISISEGDILNLQAQFIHLIASVDTANPRATTDTHWSLLAFNGGFPQITSGGGNSGGLARVITDDTLTGNGRATTPLGVAVPITAAQRTNIAALPPANQIPRVLNALPTGGIVAGEVVIVDGVLWQARTVPGGQDFTINLEQGYDPGTGEDDTGYRRNRYGAVTDGNGNPISWLDELYAEDEDAEIILRFRSATDPGNIRLSITGKGAYTLTNAGRTTYTVTTTQGWQYQSQEFAIAPFERSGSAVLRLRPTAAITYWAATHAENIAPWAVASSSLIVPLSHISPQIARIAQLTGIRGVLDISESNGELFSSIRDNSIVPAMLRGGNKTGNYIVTYSPDASQFNSIHPRQLVSVDSTTLAFNASNVLGVVNPFTNADEQKLDGIEFGATADQTGAEIKALYESLPDTNAFTDTLLGKLDGIETGATRDLSAAEIKSLYEGNADTNAFTNADEQKLDGIEDNATADQTPAEIVAGLSGLSGNARLPASAIAGLHEAATAGVSSDATLSGNGTSASPLGVASLRGYGTKAALDAVQNPTTGFVAVVYGDSVANNGLYYRTNAAWTKIADLAVDQEGLTQTEVDARVNALRPYAATDPVNTATAAVGTANTSARGDHDHGLSSYSEAEADARVEAYTGQDSVTDTIALSRLPANLRILNAAVTDGGNRPWPDSNIEIAGPVQRTAYTAQNILLNNPVWGGRATRLDGTRVAPAHFRIRFAKSAYTTTPAIAELPNLRVLVDSGEGLTEQLATLISLAGDTTHWLADASVTALPAGEPGLSIEIAEPTELDLAVADDSITPEDLKVMAGSRQNGRAVTYEEGEFGSVRVSDQRTLLDADLPLLRVSSGVGSDSGIVSANFTEQLNVITEPHGIVSGSFPISIADGAHDSIGFEPTNLAVNPSRSTIVSFTTTVEDIAREPAYDATAQHYGLVVAKQDVYRGAQKVGQIVFRIPRTGNTGLAGLNEEYLAYRGHTLNDVFNANARGQIYLLGTGAPRGSSGGQWYQFQALPDAADFIDGDLILVTAGAGQGAYTKTSVTAAHSADTGLGGITINPTADLVSRPSGTEDHLYAARNALNTDLPATVGHWLTKAAPNTMPAALDSLDLNFDHTTHDNGEVRLRYSSARSYTGTIAISVGQSPTYQIVLNRRTETTWLIDGLTAQEVRALESQPWTFSEPQAMGYTVTHAFTRILAGEGQLPLAGTAALLSAGTDAVQRTWPATVLSAGGPKREVLLDATVGGTDQLHSQTASIGTLSRALTAADDHKVMMFEVNIGTSKSAARVTSNQVRSGQAVTQPQSWRYAAAGEAVCTLPYIGNPSSSRPFDSIIRFRPSGAGNRSITITAAGQTTPYLNGIRVTLLG